MAKKPPKKPKQAAKARKSKALPPGVKLLRTLKGHQGQVLRVAFDPQGGILASASADKTVKIWDPTQDHPVKELNDGRTESVTNIAFSPNGRLLACATGKIVEIWDVQLGRRIR